MGYSTSYIDIKKGLALTNDKEVVSASKEEYFNHKKWRNLMLLKSCEDKERNDIIVAIIFTLINGDFIEVNM